MSPSKFRVLYSDIGGVLATNGWDANLRKKIAAHFKVKLEEIEAGHHLAFDSYERGYMGFDEYLQLVFFSSPRPFTVEEVREYSFSQSIAWPENMNLFRIVKESNRLKLALISNEGSDLTEYRVRKFGLRDLADFMIFSHFVHFRKPDREIWRLALSLAQVTPAESIYIDDREMFVEVAEQIGFTAIHHVSLESTSEKFQKLGLAVK